MKTYDFRIIKKLTFLNFKHDLICLYKDDLYLRQTVPRFQLGYSWGIRQMFKISNILTIDNF